MTLLYNTGWTVQRSDSQYRWQWRWRWRWRWRCRWGWRWQRHLKWKWKWRECVRCCTPGSQTVFRFASGYFQHSSLHHKLPHHNHHYHNSFDNNNNSVIKHSFYHHQVNFIKNPDFIFDVNKTVSIHSDDVELMMLWLWLCCILFWCNICCWDVLTFLLFFWA